MLLTALLLVVLVGFYALFGALLHFAEGVIREPSSVASAPNRSRQHP